MGGSYSMAQAHYVYFALYFYYYCILVISDHQTLDCRGHNNESIRCDSNKELEVRKVNVSQSENLEDFHIVEDLTPVMFIWETVPFK